MQEMLEEYLEENYVTRFKVDYLDIRKYWIETLFILSGKTYKIGFVFTPDYHLTDDANCRHLETIINTHFINLLNKKGNIDYNKI